MRYSVRPYKGRFWAVWDGPVLVCVTVYKRGAQEVACRLAEAQEVQREEHAWALSEAA